MVGGEERSYHGASTKEDFMKLTRVELVQICKKNKSKAIYEVSVLTQRFDCDVLFLPVAHPEFNPIEMTWSQVKGYVTKNVRFSMREVEKLVHHSLDAFDEDQWKKYADYCIKVENQYRPVAGDINVE